MKEAMSEFMKDKIVRISISASIVLLVISLSLFILTYNDYPPYVPVFNSMPWGEGRLYSSSILLFSLPCLFIVFIFNNVIGALLYKKYTLVSRTLSFNSFLFLLIALIGYIQILFLIF